MEKIDLSIVEKNYSIEIEYIKQIKTNAFFVKTSDKDNYFLKWSRVDKNKVDFIIDIYKHLKNTDFKSHLIDFERTTSGGFYFLDKEKRIYLLCKWIESRTADYKDSKDIEIVVDTLSKLHRSTADFETSHKDRVLSKYETIFKEKYSQIMTIKNIIHQRKKLTTFDRYYLNTLKRFEDRFVECMISIKKIEDEFKKNTHRVLIHHDPAHHNFLINQRNIYLIDFDYSIIDYDVHDFANLIVRILKTNQWDISILKFIIKLLLKKKIPGKFWFEVFFVLILFPQEIWQVGIQYYYEKQPWSEKYFMKRLTGAIEIQSKKEMVLKKLTGGKVICL